MSQIGQLVGDVIGVDSPTVTIPDYAAAPTPEAPATPKDDAEARARRNKARRTIDSYFIEVTNEAARGTDGLYIP